MGLRTMRMGAERAGAAKMARARRSSMARMASVPPKVRDGRMKKRAGMKLMAVMVFALIAAAPSSALVLDDFEDGDSAGWAQVGAYEYLGGYSVEVRADGCVRGTQGGKVAVTIPRTHWRILEFGR